MTAQNTPYVNIPGLRTEPFVATKDFTSFIDSHKEVRYCFMQAIVNEDNKLDVSIFTYSCAFREDSSFYGSSWREEQRGNWRNVSLDKAVKLLKKWDTQQKEAQAEAYKGELFCRKNNQPALQVLSDETIATLRDTLATSRQSPKTVTGEKELVSEQGLERVFNYLSAKKDEQTGLYTLMDITETQEARNKLAAFFNRYRTHWTGSEHIEQNLSLEDATQKVKAGLQKHAR